ncbi:TonB-dependent receptor [Sphingobium sp. CR2-8]|uniref:TonB-dependent receptor plug domain-containing protein n=1 Tax=Sphingobium sp. CR2-8 TaxID=1306534 RepID=UPI002DBB121E|nr:TonB-dependent receptor [Sphingobium sp. CR2-8]MEC3909169.1 TonB-dependent receptor [Sphingobium sp. CR2-8]
MSAACWLPLAVSFAHAAEPMEQAGPAQQDAIIVTGTRKSDRTLAQSLAPIDVVQSKALETVPSADLNDKLSRLIPSYQVQRNTVADGNIFFRSATLRNLSPDHTLVLVNGKRRHRSAFVDVTQLGAQAVDVAQIPAIALKQVEVLRDGASAQYGSDAIAGVINFILEDRPGVRGYVQAGQYYAGDGENYQAGISGGLALGDRGSLTISLEYNDGDRTARNDQNDAAQALIDNGGRFGNAAFYRDAIRNPAQRIGQPRQQNYRSFVHAKLDLTDDVSLYSFGSYGYSKGENDFIWRNPESNALFDPLPLWGNWTLRSVYPGGFAPNFKARSKDVDMVAGLKGKLTDDFAWDLSGRYGRNQIRYNLDNTINASLGPDSPTSFYAGSRTQTEYGANLDLTWQPDVGLSTPLTVAFGGEYRHEEYRAGTGEAASYALGPGAAFGYPGGANGFFGTDPTQAGTFGRHSVAAYADLDAQIAPSFEVDVAGRFEHYSDAGSAWTGKIAARYEMTRALAIRGAFSTGFRAPTPGQANLTNTSQRPTDDGLSILTRGTIPSINPVAVLRGGRALKPERSVNISAGFAYALSSRANLTVDYYNIRVKDRLGLSANYTLTPQERTNLVASGVTLAQGLDTFNFYVNGFVTRTQGVDAVLSYQFPVAAETTVGLTALYNYNQTRVIRADRGVLSPLLRQSLEDRLPHHKASFTIDASHRQLQATLRGTWLSAWTQPFFDNVAMNQRFGSEAFLDASLSYAVTPAIKATIGVENFLGNYPDREIALASLGARYPVYRPYEADGGRYYVRLGVSF